MTDCQPSPQQLNGVQLDAMTEGLDIRTLVGLQTVERDEFSVHCEAVGRLAGTADRVITA